MISPDSIRFHLVKDGKVINFNSTDHSISYYTIDFYNAEIEGKPFLTEIDIIEYQWASHTMKVPLEVIASFPNAPGHGLPFILILNNERLYLGALFSSFSSLSCYLPTIETPIHPKSNEITIHGSYPFGNHFLKGPDPRFDPRLKQALLRLKKYE